jgi:hypothetical protein
LKSYLAGKRNEILAQISSKDANYFEIELDKLDKWGRISATLCD